MELTKASMDKMCTRAREDSRIAQEHKGAPKIGLIRMKILICLNLLKRLWVVTVYINYFYSSIICIIWTFPKVLLVFIELTFIGKFYPDVLITNNPVVYHQRKWMHGIVTTLNFLARKQIYSTPTFNMKNVGNKAMGDSIESSMSCPPGQGGRKKERKIAFTCLR